ncbi:MAG: hypothetical protein WDO73_12795 [Ignavibacteriota bacterium]
MILGLMPYDPNYTGYLIGYSTTAEVKVDTTYDPDKLTTAVDRMKPGGGSSLYNAIYMACTNRKLVPGEPYQPRASSLSSVTATIPRATTVSTR